MSTITSISFAKALWPGVKGWYGNEYSMYPEEYTKLFASDKSSRQWEEFVGYSGFGLQSIKPEGSPITYDSERQGFTTRFTHVTYALGFIVTREMFEDDLYDVVGKRKAKGLAKSVRLTKEIVGANVYNRAFNTSYTFGDGKAMIVSDHPNIAGGTWSNVISVAADLSEAALEQAIIDIEDFRDDRGNLIAVKPTSLIIPRQLQFDATRILKSEGRVATADNDLNAIKTMGLVPEIVVNHYLTDSDAWFIRTNQEGLLHLERRADDFEMDNDFDTENAKFKATARYCFGVYDPRSIYGSPGA